MVAVDAVRDFLVENFLFGDGKGLKADTSFLENGVIDSTGILELVSFLEQTYHISIQDDDLIPENLDSLACIGRFLECKLDSRKS
jgi:acyl carrier protein